jgi:hypothetical protein
MKQAGVGGESNPIVSGFSIDWIEIWNNLSDTVQKVWDLGEEDLVCFSRCGPVARDTAFILAINANQVASAFSGGWLDPTDAFRHCYWSCTMAQNPLVGPRCAEEVGYIHEWANPGTVENETLMDLHNNRIGRDIGASGGDCIAGCLSALNNLELWWIQGGFGFGAGLPDSNILTPNTGG